MKFSKYFPLASLVLIAHGSFVPGAVGQPLYGLTVDGRIYSIEPSTGALTIARAQLSAQLAPYLGLAWSEGWFYTSRLATGESVRFGLVAGDEQVIGPSGFQRIECLSTRPDGSILATVSANADGAAERVGVLNKITGHVDQAVPFADPSVAWDVQSLATTNDGHIYAANVSSPSALFSLSLPGASVSDVHALVDLPYSMALSCSGELFAVFGTSLAGNPPTSLRLLAPATGAAASIATWPDIAIVSIAFRTCRADRDCDGQVTPSDVAVFVGTWFTCLTSGSPAGDFDGNGAVEPADVASYVNAWFGALNNGC